MLLGLVWSTLFVAGLIVAVLGGLVLVEAMLPPVQPDPRAALTWQAWSEVRG